jgi:TctA family transporter
MASGDWTVFFTRGVSLGLFVFTLVCLAVPALRAMRRARAAA